VYDAVNSRMTVFGGGLGQSSPCTNEVWVLSNANRVGGTPAWTQLTPTGGPPVPRIFHTAAYDPATNRMIVFGGNNCFTAGAQFYNDVWVLTNANGLGGTPAWTQLTPAGGPPAARENLASVYDAAKNNLVVFGGAGSLSQFNDVWVLSNANGLGGTPTWTQLSPVGTPPSVRAGHTGVYDPNFNRMIVFSGGLVPDTWVLGNATGSTDFQRFSNPIPATTCTSPAGGECWTNSLPFPNTAAVIRNTTPNPIIYSGTTLHPPTVLNLAVQSSFPAVRWTAPAADTYTITGQFTRIDTSPNPVNVRVVQNHVTTLFSSDFFSDAFNPVPFALNNVALAAGATLDFYSGSSFGDPSDDATGLTVTITGTGPSLAGTTTATTGTNGVAVFGNVSISTLGSFRLRASQPLAGTVLSNSFTIF